MAAEDLTHLTEGQRRVGVKFNPSGHRLVDEIKTDTAMLIDMMQETTAEGCADPRCAAIAASKFEEAAMWAVKAVTNPPGDR